MVKLKRYLSNESLSCKWVIAEVSSHLRRCWARRWEPLTEAKRKRRIYFLSFLKKKKKKLDSIEMTKKKKKKSLKDNTNFIFEESRYCLRSLNRASSFVDVRNRITLGTDFRLWAAPAAVFRKRSRLTDVLNFKTPVESRWAAFTGAHKTPSKFSMFWCPAKRIGFFQPVSQDLRLLKISNLRYEFFLNLYVSTFFLRHCVVISFAWRPSISGGFSIIEAPCKSLKWRQTGLFYRFECRNDRRFSHYFPFQSCFGNSSRGWIVAGYSSQRSAYVGLHAGMR